MLPQDTGFSSLGFGASSLPFMDPILPRRIVACLKATPTPVNAFGCKARVFTQADTSDVQ